MSHMEHVGELLARLEQSGSLHAAFVDGVRLACKAGGCLAGAVVAEPDAACATSFWFRHDPHGLLERLTADGVARGVPESSEPYRTCDVSVADGALRQVDVRLCCAGRDAGRLVLLAPQEAVGEQVNDRIAGVGTLLALLMIAAENNISRPLSGLMGREAFRARVASELSRSERHTAELSVLHIRIGGVHGSANDDTTGPWTRIALIGEVLAPQLRKSDAVGLLGPDHLAVLLAGTGRLGARIAMRRIEQIVSTATSELSNGSTVSVPPSECLLRTFPDDGEDVDDFCRIQPRCTAATVSAVLPMSPT